MSTVPTTPSAAPIRNRFAFLQSPLVTRVRDFLIGQVAIQGLTALIGFLLVRWMPQAEYGKFSVAFAFQGILAMFTDVGISNCIIALSGENSHDPAVVGRYLAAARDLRGKMFWITMVFAVIAFPFIVGKQESWTLTDKIFLLSSVLFSVFIQGWGMYQSPLIINGQMKRLYAPQTTIGVGRLVCSYLLYATHLISGALTSWLNAIALAINTFFIYRSAKALVITPEQSRPEDRQAILRFITPLVPGIIITALQGQIALLAITYFGKESSVADTAVLGRLVQLVLIIVAFNSVILEPIIGRTPEKRLHKLVAVLVAGAVALSAALVAFVYFCPRVVVWIVTEKYAHLQSEFVLAITVSVVGYIANLFYVINSARRWLLWWTTILYLVVMIGGQAICFAMLDMSKTHNALLLNLVINSCVLGTHVICTLYNLIRIQLRGAEPAPAAE